MEAPGRHNWPAKSQYDKKIWKTQASPVDFGSTEPDGTSELFATWIDAGHGCDGAQPCPCGMDLHYKALCQPIDCIALAVADDVAVDPEGYADVAMAELIPDHGDRGAALN